MFYMIFTREVAHLLIAAATAIATAIVENKLR